MKRIVHITCFILLTKFCVLGQAYTIHNIADTSIIKSITGTSLIKNITDTLAWQYKNGEKNYTISDSTYTLHIKNPGSARWNVQITQKTSLDTGSFYFFSFIASSNNPRQMESSICRESDHFPYSSRDTIPLTTSPRLFTFPFTMAFASDTNAIVEFNCGLDSGDIKLSHVSLIKLDKPFLQFITPQDKKLFHERDVINITWLSIGNQKPITIEYSTDQSKSWHTLVSGIQDTGSYKWTNIPKIFSPWYTLRIYSDGNVNAPFDTSNTFEVAPQTELINGTFTNCTNWKFFSATLSTFLFNKACEIDIITPGVTPRDIRITKGDLPFHENFTYVLSFTASSSKNDSIFVNIISAKDSTKSFLTNSSMKILLTPSKSFFTTQFTASVTDTGILEFSCGLSNSIITLDDVSLVKNHNSQLKAIYTVNTNKSKNIKVLPSKLVSFGNGTRTHTINKLAVKQPLYDLMGRAVRNRSTTSRNALNVSSGMYIPEPYRIKR